MKFLDVRTDFAFKKVFGSKDSKPRLMSLLNAIIDFEYDITDLEIVDPYNLPQLKGMKDTFVDVKAVLADDSTVIIEMQVLNHPGFENRVLYNAAKNYATQLVKGQRYDLLKPVIALTIVNFTLFDDNETVVNCFKMINKETLSDYSDDIELIFIELPKFKKELAQCQDIMDHWFFFLKHAGDLTVIPKDLPVPVQTAYEVSNEAGMSKEELELQYNKQQYIAIQRGSLDLAEQKGLQAGLEQGIQKSSLSIAKKMQANGLALDLIEQLTDIRLSE